MSKAFLSQVRAVVSKNAGKVPPGSRVLFLLCLLTVSLGVCARPAAALAESQESAGSDGAALQARSKDDAAGRCLDNLSRNRAAVADGVPIPRPQAPEKSEAAKALPADSDNDGMPDSWETANSLNPGSADDAWSDPDGDAVPNLFEYQLGANPKSGATPPRVTVGPSGATYTNVETALSSAAQGTCIRVAAGTYPVTYSALEGFNPMPKAMVQGGWNSSFTARDLAAYPTVLTGGNSDAIFLVSCDTLSPVLVLDGLKLTGARGFWGAVGMVAGTEATDAAFTVLSLRDCAVTGCTSTQFSVVNLCNWMQTSGDYTFANTVISGNTVPLGMEQGCLSGQCTEAAQNRWRFVNCTFANSSADTGLDLFTLDSAVTTVRFSNCIAWGQTANLSLSAFGGPLTFTADHSDIGPMESMYAAYIPVTGVFSQSPLLTNPASGDCHLLAGSPCIDTGTTTFAVGHDYEGGPRSGVHDIGADEYLPPSNLAGPSNPGFTNTGTTSITWTWRDNSNNETGFKVWADPGAEPPTTLRTTTAAGAVSWLHAGLTPNTQYVFQAAATNGTGDSVKTANLAHFTLCGPPSAGNNVTCNRTVGTLYPASTVFSFANPEGFGEGMHGESVHRVSQFLHAWDTSPTHVFTGSEPVWNAAGLSKTPNASGDYYLHLQSVNAEGVAGGTLDYGPFRMDKSVPTVTVNQGGAQADPANALPLAFDAVFSEDVTGFDAADVTQTGTATGVTFAVTAVDGAHYTVTATAAATDGTVRPMLAAGRCADPAGNANLASTSTDNTVTLDRQAPVAVVTLDNPTPTGANTVRFSVDFSESVGASFTDADITVTGTLPGTVSVSGAGPAYTVTVTVAAPDADGTLGIAVGTSVTDAAGNSCAGAVSPFYTVVNWPDFTAEPQGGRKYTGDAHTFEVQTGTGPFTPTFQWRWDNGSVVQDGPTTPAWALSGLAQSNSGHYWCEVTYNGVTYPSNKALLAVKDHLHITDLLDETRVTHQPCTFTVTATGGHEPLTYGWSKDGASLPGAVDNSYTIADLAEEDGGTYTVEVADSGADMLSSSATLSVLPGVPAAGLLGASCLAGMLALLGAARTRRR